MNAIGGGARAAAWASPLVCPRSRRSGSGATLRIYAEQPSEARRRHSARLLITSERAGGALFPAVAPLALGGGGGVVGRRRASPPCERRPLPAEALPTDLLRPDAESLFIY